MQQQRYWNQLKQLRTHVYYLHFYAAESDQKDKVLNIFLAVTSSASIAAWAVWKQLGMLWAILIAASQVITAVKPFLPYKQRVKAICDLNDAIQSIALESEKHWFYVADGRLEDEEIHKKYIELADKLQKAEQKYSGRLVLPHKKDLVAKAEIEADKYLMAHYHGE